METAKKLFENGLDVMLVEDDAFLASLLVKALEDKGAHVIHASDGKLAIATLETFQPQVILLDLMLPGEIDGFGVMAHVRSNEKTKNVITMILSNLQEKAQIEKAKALHADAYMIKATVTPDEVVRKVKALIDSKKTV